MSVLTLVPEGQSAEVPDGLTLREALARLGTEVLAPCGGEGTCGKCRVLVHEGAAAPLPEENALLTPEQLAQGLRLSCRVRVAGPMQVEVPASSRRPAMRILPGGVNRPVPIDPAVTKELIHLEAQKLDQPWARLEHLRFSGELRADLRADLDLLRRLPALLDGEPGTFTAVLREDRLLDVERGDTTGRCFGVALDLGTTTVVASLVDLTSGREVGHAAVVNRQTTYGHDVIARINHTIEGEAQLEELRVAAVQSLQEVIDQALEKAEVKRDEVYEATLVGNSTMMHLFLGISPLSLGHLPYVAMFNDALEMPAHQAGIALNPVAWLYMLPEIAGFVGADTVGAILATSLDEDEGRIRLMADIGTNCELALRHGKRLLVTSTPAGPAFEGARIACGMYAAPGAIEEVHLDGTVKLKVIGGGEPRGLCGSGLLDAGAELVRHGIVDETGRLLDPEEVQNPAWRERLIEQEEEERALVLAWREGEPPLALTQRDIRELQLAKGSIRTAIDFLLEKTGLTPDDLDEFCLAGGFGNYLDEHSALRLGLLPAMDPKKIHFVGNGALVGARLALISRDLRQRGALSARQAEHLQLAGTPDFQMRFAESMLFTGGAQ
ncbi:MAG: DUF4445 domain-containing protein [Candidatus Latescibacteria bacterium]|nr:DUF4445 domain-containing protein [Candidatus Latescibacterota bacterium]